MRVPQNIVTTIASAATGSGAYTYDLSGVDRASIQIAATLTGVDTDVVTLKLSNDGTNFVGFSTAKTVTFTGGGTVNALFELGAIDYRYLQVAWAAPSADAVTLVAILHVTATVTQYV